MKIKKNIKRAFKFFGYDLVKLKGGLGRGTFENELIKILNSVNADLVLDIGANRGQFANSLYDYGYKNKVISFEPLSAIYESLKENAKNNNLWNVYDRCCIGNEEKMIDINVSNLIGNSSILEIKSTKFNVPQSHYIKKEQVPQITLETLNENHLVKQAKNVFVKMDIQGYEHIVLSEFPKVKYNIVGFYLELSLVNLYEEQRDYLYICNQLKEFGFDLVYIEPEYIISNRMIQFNGLFLHKSLSFIS
ncbi:MAG TPA: FkbM family methyltransferase [Lutibacter sp.]